MSEWDNHEEARRSADRVSGGSIFDLPVSSGARLARVALVLLLDALLVGAGIFMMISYSRGRNAPHSAAVTEAPDAAVGGAVALEPSPVPVEEQADAPRKKSPRPRARKNVARRARGGIDSRGSRKLEDASVAGRDDATEDTAAPVDAAPVGAGETEHATGPAPDSGPADGVASDEDVGRVARQIRRVVDKHQNGLDACYRRAAKVGDLEDELRGKIVVRLVAEPDGSTSDVRSTQNTTGSPDLAQCLVHLVEQLRLPSHEFEPLAFQWPFVFSPERP